MRKYEIKGHVTETKWPNQNEVEGCIRELLQRWYCIVWDTLCSQDYANHGVSCSRPTGIYKFVKEYVAPEKMTYDGVQEQIGRKTEFQRVMRKYEIKGYVTEKKRPNQNEVEGCIRELRRRWYRTMFRTYCPKALWSYGIPYVAKIMQITA